MCATAGVAAHAEVVRFLVFRFFSNFDDKKCNLPASVKPTEEATGEVVVAANADTRRESHEREEGRWRCRAAPTDACRFTEGRRLPERRWCQGPRDEENWSSRSGWLLQHSFSTSIEHLQVIDGTIAKLIQNIGAILQYQSFNLSFYTMQQNRTTT